MACGECRGVDPERRQEARRHRAVGARAVDGERAAIDELDLTAQSELVAFGVAAEIVMVVEDQDASAGPRLCPVEIGGGEPADPAADHDQIVALSGIDWCRSGYRRGAVAQSVGCLEAPGMAPAHSGQSGRVIAGAILGSNSAA